MSRPEEENLGSSPQSPFPILSIPQPYLPHCQLIYTNGKATEHKLAASQISLLCTERKSDQILICSGT